MSSQPFLSIISPVYQAQGIVQELVSQISAEVRKITDNFEIILIEDRSRDNSWQAIREECKKHQHLKAIRLSKNFGQHPAITAGIRHAKGDYIVIMDCDLQDDPKYISELINKAKEGYDVVLTIKEKRKHGLLKNLLTECYNRVFAWLTDNKTTSTDSSIGAYSLITRKVASAFNQVQDYHRHYLLILRWLGFNTGYISIKHQKRFSGKTSYTFSKLIKHAVNGITSQSLKLLTISIGIGALFCVLSFGFAGTLITLYFLHGFKEGWTSIIVLILLVGGVIMMTLGILGLYIGKIFDQVRQRPLYIVDERINMES